MEFFPLNGGRTTKKSTRTPHRIEGTLYIKGTRREGRDEPKEDRRGVVEKMASKEISVAELLPSEANLLEAQHNKGGILGINLKTDAQDGTVGEEGHRREDVGMRKFRMTTLGIGSEMAQAVVRTTRSYTKVLEEIFEELEKNGTATLTEEPNFPELGNQEETRTNRSVAEHIEGDYPTAVQAAMAAIVNRACPKVTVADWITPRQAEVRPMTTSEAEAFRKKEVVSGILGRHAAPVEAVWQRQEGNEITMSENAKEIGQATMTEAAELYMYGMCKEDRKKPSTDDVVNRWNNMWPFKEGNTGLDTSDTAPYLIIMKDFHESLRITWKTIYGFSRALRIPSTIVLVFLPQKVRETLETLTFEDQVEAMEYVKGRFMANTTKGEKEKEAEAMALRDEDEIEGLMALKMQDTLLEWQQEVDEAIEPPKKGATKQEAEKYQKSRREAMTRRYQYELRETLEKVIAVTEFHNYLTEGPIKRRSANKGCSPLGTPSASAIGSGLGESALDLQARIAEEYRKQLARPKWNPRKPGRWWDGKENDTRDQSELFKEFTMVQHAKIKEATRKEEMRHEAIRQAIEKGKEASASYRAERAKSHQVEIESKINGLPTAALDKWALERASRIVRRTELRGDRKESSDAAPSDGAEDEDSIKERSPKKQKV